MSEDPTLDPLVQKAVIEGLCMLQARLIQDIVDLERKRDEDLKQMEAMQQTINNLQQANDRLSQDLRRAKRGIGFGND